jgi:hypothetical protein
MKMVVAVLAVLVASCGPTCEELGGENRTATTLGGWDVDYEYQYGYNPMTNKFEYHLVSTKEWNPSKVVTYWECVGTTSPNSR